MAGACDNSSVGRVAVISVGRSREEAGATERQLRDKKTVLAKPRKPAVTVLNPLSADAQPLSRYAGLMRLAACESLLLHSAEWVCTPAASERGTPVVSASLIRPNACPNPHTRSAASPPPSAHEAILRYHHVEHTISTTVDSSKSLKHPPRPPPALLPTHHHNHLSSSHHGR